MNYFEELKNKNEQEYIDLANKIIKKSNFKIESLGEYIAHFLTLFYGEKFVYVEGRRINNGKIVYYRYISRRKDKDIVIDSSFNKEDKIILNISNNKVTNQTIYYLNEDNKIDTDISMPSFVLEFINELINIKMNGEFLNSTSISNIEYQLLNKYYKIIVKNYDALYKIKVEQLTNELNNQFQEKYATLNRIIKKEEHK